MTHIIPPVFLLSGKPGGIIFSKEINVLKNRLKILILRNSATSEMIWISRLKSSIDGHNKLFRLIVGVGFCQKPINNCLVTEKQS